MRVVEIFQSIDGEGPNAGKLSNFIRLAGCNLQCGYCDTEYAHDWKSSMKLTIPQVIERLNPKITNVTLTGGEPLLSRETAAPLLGALLKEGFHISVETNGSIPLEEYIRQFPAVQYIVDYKSLSSGMSAYNYLENYTHLRPADAIKFVVGTQEDLQDMLHFYQTTLLQAECLPPLYISPVWGKVELQAIVEFMKTHTLNDFRLQIQLHKIIWNPQERGV